MDRKVAQESSVQLRTLLALPLAAALALVLHKFIAKNELPDETRSYTIVRQHHSSR